MQSIPLLEVRVSYCNDEILKLTEAEGLSKELVAFRIRYWEFQIMVAEKQILAMRKLEKILADEL